MRGANSGLRSNGGEETRIFYSSIMISTKHDTEHDLDGVMQRKERAG